MNDQTVEAIKMTMEPIEAFIAQHFDDIFLSVFAILFVLALGVWSQLRGIGPIRFSFARNNEQYLTPLGRKIYLIRNFIGLCFFIFIISIIAWMIFTTPEETTSLIPATDNP